MTNPPDHPSDAQRPRWEQKGPYGEHVEHPTKGGFRCASPEAARWAIERDAIIAAHNADAALREAVEALVWANLYERDVMETDVLKDWAEFKAEYAESEHCGDCTRQAQACMRCHCDMVIARASALRSPATGEAP
jgi:hypothetical protein